VSVLPLSQEALNLAFKQVCDRLSITGSTPVIELVAMRVLELAYAGECDADKLTEIVLIEFAAAL
jgi:hypothetical protein